ncbi:CLUMA_CG001975, isoform A [Clunio marinus]|uniref:Gustatory receptor n=1 Tax=Clunio marinus TaxID=568069 RepID=A0A1J1HKY2_9DIPT|nr:CLUMA_CG001975, isoform A [Clunio marinus]
MEFPQETPVSKIYQDKVNGSLVLLEVFCLQHFSVKKLDDKTFKDCPSIFRLIYMICFLTLVASVMVFYIIEDEGSLSIKEVQSKNFLAFAIKTTMNLGIFGVVCTNVIQSYLTTKNTKKIHLTSMEMARILRDVLKCPVDFDRLTKFTMRRLLFTVCFFLINHCALILFKLDDRRLMSVVVGSLPMFMLFLCAFKFNIYVWWINNQIQYLNMFLKTIFQKPVTKVISTINQKVFPINPQISYQNYMAQLLEARKMFNKIFSISSLLNQNQGMLILMMLTVLLVALTASIYDVFIIALGEMKVQELPDKLHIISICSSLLLSIAIYCQKTQNVMCELATTLDVIQCEQFENIPTNVQIFLQSFYLQVNHQPVSFSAFGFYTINLTLLASIITGIVSYEIILVQFYAS